MSNVVWNLGIDFAGGGQHFAYSVLYKLFEKAAITNPSATSFLMKDGLNIAIFHGSFVLNGNVIQSGTITGFDVYYDTPTSHLAAASGYAIDANAFKQALSEWKANDSIPLTELIYGNPMTVNGSPFYPDQILGGLANDHLYGLGGDDQIFDNGGDDFISGGEGNDVIYGGPGSDTADYSEKADSVFVTLNGPTQTVVKIGGFDEDKLIDVENIIAGKGNDNIVGDGRNNRFAGNIGDDALSGNDGNDALFGGAGRDTIKGGRGNDEIDGGDGNDIVKGGRNSDTFVFDSALGPGNIDRIARFSPSSDVIDLRHGLFSALDLGGLKGKFFHAGAKAGDANDHLIYDDKTGALFYDPDGKGGTHQVKLAILTGHPHLTHDDFFVI